MGLADARRHRARASIDRDARVRRVVLDRAHRFLAVTSARVEQTAPREARAAGTGTKSGCRESVAFGRVSHAHARIGGGESDRRAERVRELLERLRGRAWE